MSIVAETYSFVVGVDTHAATHSYAIVSCPTGTVIDQRTFPTSPAGLSRARAWIARRAEHGSDGVLVSMEGTGSYGALLTTELEHAGCRVVEAPRPVRSRGTGKTDSLDALRAARAVLGTDTDALCAPRSGQVTGALQVLIGAREHATAERTRCINALTALVRSHPLGMDARKALSRSQIHSIAAWRARGEPLAVATARSQAVALAKRIEELQEQLATNRARITELVQEHAGGLLGLPGVGAVTAAIALIVWSYPGRIRSEAAWAQIAGTCPIPASSGNITRHRLNRGGDRRLNRAINTVVLTRWRVDEATHAYVERRRAQGKSDREIRRCLKRYVSRQIFRSLAAIPPVLEPQTA